LSGGTTLENEAAITGEDGEADAMFWAAMILATIGEAPAELVAGTELDVVLLQTGSRAENSGRAVVIDGMSSTVGDAVGGVPPPPPLSPPPPPHDTTKSPVAKVAAATAAKLKVVFMMPFRCY
jgi:hypothetical protein